MAWAEANTRGLVLALVWRGTRRAEGGRDNKDWRSVVGSCFGRHANGANDAKVLPSLGGVP